MRSRYVRKSKRTRTYYRRGYGKFLAIPQNKLLKKSAVVDMNYKYSGTMTLGSLGNSHLMVRGESLRINSIYDPDPSIAGEYNTSASWYTFYSNMYNHYDVISAEIITTFRQRGYWPASVNPATNPNVVLQPILKVGCKLDDNDTFAAPTWVDLSCDPQVSMKTLAFNAQGTGKAVVVQRWSPSKDGGKNLDTYGSDFGSNPSNLKYIMPWMQSENLGELNLAIANTVNYTTELRLKVRLSDPKDVGDFDSGMKVEQGVST